MNRPANKISGTEVARCQRCGHVIPPLPDPEPVCPACVADVMLVADAMPAAGPDDTRDASEPPDLGMTSADDGREAFLAHDACVARSHSSVKSDIDELSPTVIPGFHLLEPIGRGGMGVVYRAMQEAPRREVAIKLFCTPGVVTSFEARQRFIREIELAGRLRHPGIVPLYACGLAREKRLLYYVMELVDGMPLGDFLEAHVLSFDAELALFQKLCAPVIYAHRHGVIHRDLTPANIIVTPEGEPRLLDFGLGKALAVADETTGCADMASIHNSIVGSPCTMAPEQAAGNPAVDTRSDVYSLGAILFHLVTGDWPHDQGGSLVDVLHRIIREPARPASRFRKEVDDRLQAILDKALTTDADDRYPSAEALRDDVERYRRNEELSVQSSTSWQKFHLWRKRKPLAAALWLVTVLLLMTLAVGGPLVALREARLQAEIRKHEGVRLENLIQLLIRADAENVTTVFQIMEPELPALEPLLRKQLSQPDLEPEAKVRLKAALLGFHGGDEEELFHVLETTPDVNELRFLAHALRRHGRILSPRFRQAISDYQQESDPSDALTDPSTTETSSSVEMFTIMVALAAWEPEDTAFWNRHASCVAKTLVREVRRRGDARDRARAFSAIGTHLLPHLSAMVAEGATLEGDLLAHFLDEKTLRQIDDWLRSDAAFVEKFPRFEADREETLAILNALFRGESKLLRSLSDGDPGRERLARMAVAKIRLDRETDAWRHLGYRWALRETLIGKLSKLGVGPDLLYWKWSRTTADTLSAEGIRRAITRCFLELPPEAVDAHLREEILAQQRRLLRGDARSAHSEPLETARRLLLAWDAAESSAAR